MQISSRFTIALHIFTCADVFQDQYKVTSDFLAGSINTNPVIIRKILAQLKKAGLIKVARGTGGIAPTRPLSEISFYDVYQAIEPVENGDLFHFHESPNPDCPVGRNIHGLLDEKLKAIQGAMEAEMKKITVEDLHEGIAQSFRCLFGFPAAACGPAHPVLGNRRRRQHAGHYQISLLADDN